MLARDLKTLSRESDDEEFQRLCSLIEENYDYPVDSVVVSAALEVLGHVNVNQSAFAGSRGYLAFLNGEEVKARDTMWVSGGPGHSHDEHSTSNEHNHEVAPTPEIVLTPEEPSRTLLDVIQSPAEGQPPFKLFPVDTRAFPQGGVLEIHVEVGLSETAGGFELLRSDLDSIPPSMFPVTGLRTVQPGAKRTMTFEFEEGERFHLLTRVTQGSPDGTVNAFRAELRVKEE